MCERIIPSIPRASNTNWGVEVPELEPGISGPMGENQARDIVVTQIYRKKNNMLIFIDTTVFYRLLL